MYRHAAIAAVLIAACAPASQAACASDAEIAAFVESFAAREPARALGADGTIEDALCTQAKLADAMRAQLGPVVGYKAGLTSAPAQERFGVTEPVRGLLYRDMMLKDGAEVPATFGAVPLFEADLMLEVAAAGINEADTPEEVMRHVASVRPFIELPDLMVAQGEPLTGETITAMGVGARMGVLGEALPVEDPAAMARALGEMTVTVSAADGSVLAEVPGAAVLGHPAEAVIWLVSKGVELTPGDLVSVGSFGPLLPPAQAGGEATVRYAGLPGDPTVTVRFTE
jgi:2-oxo-hept-3-ene-1,7-dioate hydratase